MDAELLRTLQPGAVALGWTLLDFLWQGLLVGLAYVGIRAAWRAPRHRLMAGHITLMALVLTPLATFIGHLQDGARPTVLQAAGGAVMSAMQAAPARETGIAADTWLLWLVAAWIAGVLVLSLRLWHEWRRLRRLCEQAAPVDAQWQRRFERLAARLGVRLRVRLRQGADIVTPMLVGVLRPTILLPASLLARLPTDQVELILVHELAHLRRLDPLFNLLQTGLDTLLFYHPVVHWISRKVREDRELCCDEVVVNSGGDRIRYARALLALAESQTHDVPLPALAAAGGALLERVERIVQLPQARASNSQSLVAAALLGVLALAWFVPREQKIALLQALPVALVPGAASIDAPAYELAIADIATQFIPVFAPRVEPDVLPEPEVPLPISPEIVQIVDATASAATTDHAPTSLASAPVEPASAPVDTTMGTTMGTPALAAPVPTRRVAPAYPRAARLRGVEGWVVLDYRIDGAGRVTDIAIREAQPEGAFDLVARRALERWRYRPAATSMGTLTQRFDFVLSEEEQRGDDGRCRRQTGSRVCRPLQELLPGSSVSLSVN